VEYCVIWTWSKIQYGHHYSNLVIVLTLPEEKVQWTIGRMSPLYSKLLAIGL